MLSDEEKKSIDIIKTLIQYLNVWKENYTIVPKDVKYLDTVLNLIEKQSKEIEEYKKQLDLDYVRNNYTSNDKIKSKIEEVEQWELYNMKIPKLSTLDERLGAKIGIKYVLQSLLEKE